MAKRATSVIGQLQIFENEIARLENMILELEQKMQQQHQIHRNHLMRVKNHEELSDEFIEHGKKYQDLSPDRAWNLYNNPDFNFILIDVSSEDFKTEHQLPEAIRMPWEQFVDLSLQLASSTTPIMVISEDGTSSILACEFLVNRGFYNCSNISGGYQYWKGSQLRSVESA